MTIFTKNNFCRSMRVVFVVCVLFFLLYANVNASSDTTIHLDIETASTTLFSGDIVVAACADSASSTPIVTAYCAIEQTGLMTDWSHYGSDAFLNSISGIANSASTGEYWGWFSDLNYGQTSLNAHVLSVGEHLLVNIGTMPLKITVSSSTPYVGATTTISVLEFGFDASWNGVWKPSASSSVGLDDNIFPTNEYGQYDFLVSSTSSIVVSALKNGFLPPAKTTISPMLGEVVPPPVATSSPVVQDSVSTATPPPSHTIDTQKAIQFLLARQKPDGSFGSGMYSDWVAIALGGQGLCNSNLISYLKNTEGYDFVKATDYERHAMALMACGTDPYEGTPTNFIQKILDQFDGTQVGDSSLVNDDIFALFPLIASGYTTSDSIITSILHFILSKQQTDGSWQGSVDLTAAAIQALSTYTSFENAATAIASARTYLSSHQMPEGGFGNSFSTSWVLQAAALVDQNSSMQYLASLQQVDGGFDALTVDESTRVWATAYAIPAALNKSWFAILKSFPKRTSNTIKTAPTVETVLSEHISTTTLEISEQATPSVFSVIQPNNIPMPPESITPTRPHIPETNTVLPEITQTQDATTTAVRPQVAAVVAAASEASYVVVIVIVLLLFVVSMLFMLLKKKK